MGWVIGIALFVLILILTNYSTKKDAEDQQREAQERRQSGQLFSVKYSRGHCGLNNVWSNGPNSAHGWSVKFDVKNWATQAAKYYVVYFVPYNAVGDPEMCTITHMSEKGARCVGPLNPREEKKTSFSKMRGTIPLLNR